ncbi:peroxidase-like protein 3 [Penaeus vannamei]|uniref:peroxidase-like protein 3 n=1 Tax=Penaeus vannamei TaxID=6689 RepID=UPI00387F3AF8
MIQHVTYAEYLPLVLGRYAQRLRLRPLNSGYSSTYSPGIDATVANVFGTAAFRFVHSMIAESLRLSPTNYVNLIDSFAKDTAASGDCARPSILKGLASSPADPVDHFFAPTLHNSFGASLDRPVGSDLYALDVQVRGRLEQ